MKYRHLMSVAAVVFLLLGLAFMMNGPWILSFYGIDLSAPSEPRFVLRTGPDPLMVGIAFMRVLGAVLAGVGVIAWMVRRVKDADVQASVLSGFFAFSGLAFLAVFLQHVQVGAFVPQLTGSSARLLVALLLLLSAAFGYLRFIKSSGQ